VTGRAGRTADAEEPKGLRALIARLFTRFEDVVYVGLGLVLAGSALGLLAEAVWSFGRMVVAGSLGAEIVQLLDRILLILMIVEILYTVQVSFREHALVPEPFLVVGLVAAIRRVLVITAEFSKLAEIGQEAFRNAMIELAVLTAMILALVGSLLLLRRRAAAVADRA
jgi:hypothetical protein